MPILCAVPLLAVACQPLAPPPPRARPLQPLQALARPDTQASVGEPPVFDGCASTGIIVNYPRQIVPAGMSEYDGKVIREISPTCRFTVEASMVSRPG